MSTLLKIIDPTVPGVMCLPAAAWLCLLLVLQAANAFAADDHKKEAAPVTPAPAATWTLPPYRPMDILSKAPAPKAAWKFVAFGDCHAMPETEEKEKNKAAFLKTFDMVERQDPSFTLLLGDIVTGDKGIGIASWHAFFRLAGPYLARRPYFFAIGNHDLHDPSLPPVYQQIYTPPNPVEGRAYYAFDHGDVRFIHLFDNRYNPKWGGLMAEWGKDMAAWIAAQCDSFTGRHLVVYSHCPPYTPSKYNDGKITKAIATEVLAPRVGRYTITVLSGHTHAYYRTNRMGINFMSVTAGQTENWGATKLRPEADRDLQPGDVLGDTNVGIAVFTVDGDSLNLNYIGLDGKTLDSATFRK